MRLQGETGNEAISRKFILRVNFLQRIEFSPTIVHCASELEMGVGFFRYHSSMFLANSLNNKDSETCYWSSYSPPPPPPSYQPHQVLIPVEEAKKRVVRQSLAFFVHPDNKVLVECVDGSNKYPPITAAEDTTRRLDRTY